MKILVTGTAGFIGYHLAKCLLEQGHEVMGLDAINDYYDRQLKYDRLSETGIAAAEIGYGKTVQSRKHGGYCFVQADLTDRETLFRLFEEERYDIVCNLAGQAGVRHSMEKPHSYVASNVVGFANVLEACRHHQVKHLVYASSSSVYGMNSNTPFQETERTDEPVSLYAATKKSNEVMAYAYSSLYGFKVTGLRFFTVYGPWGRPDMAPMKFMRAIMEGTPIQVYNHGNMLRDFTYIDDIVNGIMLVIQRRQKPGQAGKQAQCDTLADSHIYNIGCSHPIKLIDFIHTIEQVTGRTAAMQMMDMQPGDVVQTYADTSRITCDFGYRPTVMIEEGIRKLYEWYVNYYKIL